MRDLPQWATNPQDCISWKYLLDFHDIDNQAQQALFLMAARDEDGWKAANDLLAKLQSHNRGWLKNPSAFLHSAVANARNEMKWEKADNHRQLAIDDRDWGQGSRQSRQQKRKWHRR